MIDSRSSRVDLSGPAVDLDSSQERKTSNKLRVNLKNQLQLFMDHHELSATQLAKKSGVSKQVVSLWLAGASPRKIEQLKKVADTLETTVDNLCFGTSINKSKQSNEQLTDDWLSGIFEIKVRRLNK